MIDGILCDHDHFTRFQRILLPVSRKSIQMDGMDIVRIFAVSIGRITNGIIIQINCLTGVIIDLGKLVMKIIGRRLGRTVVKNLTDQQVRTENRTQIDLKGIGC